MGSYTLFRAAMFCQFGALGAKDGKITMICLRYLLLRSGFVFGVVAQ